VNEALAPARLGIAVVLTAAAAIVYELLIGTLSTYLNGDSALQFSLTIGTFLAAMGTGAFAAREVGDDPLPRLLRIEIAVALLGGFSGLLLYAANQLVPGGYLACMVALVAAIGHLVGMELPMLAELLRRAGGWRNAFASALSLDYFGSLIGSLAFPFVLLPTFGAVKTALLTGVVNLAAVWLLSPRDARPDLRRLRRLALVALALLIAGIVGAHRIVSGFEELLYRDQVLHAETTRFQRIVVTRFRDDLRLYSDRELQFSSRDEYRYHESLVHPLLAAVRHPEQVLIVGGGDGLAVREVLKDRRVLGVTVVDIDPKMTALARSFGPIVALNRDALSDPRVRVVNADGYRFLLHDTRMYDAVVLDLPDPRTEAIARLYSREFYTRLLSRLQPDGVLTTQASSPYFTREAFWSIDATLRAAGLRTRPYRIYVPSFGEWGFVMASRRPIDWPALRLTLPRRWLTRAILDDAATFDADTAANANAPVSTFESPTVWRLYRRRVRYWKD